MSNYIQLPQSISSLPLTDSEWYWYDPYSIINSSFYKEDLLNDISKDMLNAYNFRKATNTPGAYARFDRTNYPVKILSNQVLDIVPDFSTRKKLDFVEITDTRAIDFLKKSQHYENVFLFYSGGIDSTTILCAILKTWTKADLIKITIVMNQHSIDENTLMYESYIKGNFSIVNSDDFFTTAKRDNNSLYTTGDLGDPLMSDDNTIKYDIQFPNTFNKSWKKNIDCLLKYYAKNTDMTVAKYLVSEVELSLQKLKYEIDTVYDFLWWVNFNWGWDIDLYQTWWYWRLAENTNAKKFVEDNVFYWFNTVDYQDWAINTIGTNLLVGDNIKMSKNSMKKYIYDFNHDREYFLNKVHEGSVSKNKELIPTLLCGVDSNYNIYYRKLNTIRT